MKEIKKFSNTRKLYEEILKKKKEIQHDSNIKFKTNGKFRFTDNLNGFDIDIFKETRISQLINIAGFLKSRHLNYEIGAKSLEINEYPEFNWLGYTVNDWLHDLKIRINVLLKKEKFDIINKAEFEVAQLLTEEDRTQMVMQKYQKLFNIEI